MKLKIDNKYFWEIAIIIGLFLMTASLILNHGHKWGGDFSGYIMQADALRYHAVQQYLEENTFIVINSNVVVGPTAYPWGYPLVLLPIYAWFDLNPLLLKLPGILFFAMFLLFLDLYLKDKTETYERIIIVLIMSFSPTYIAYQNEIMSEFPYMFFSILIIYLIYRYFHITNNNQNLVQAGFVLGVAIFLSNTFRGTGFLFLMVLFLAQFGYFYFKKIKFHRKHFLQLAIPYMLYILLNMLFSHFFPKGEAGYFYYLGPLKEDFFASIFNNLLIYLLAPKIFFNSMPSIDWLYYLLLAFMIIGIVVRFKQDYIVVFYAGLFLSLQILWPYYSGLRYIYSILPFFVYFSFYGMKAALSKLSFLQQKYQRFLLSIFWGTILLIFFLNSAELILINLYYDRTIQGPFDPYSTEMFNYVKENTDEDDVIIFFKPRVMKLMTGRNALLIKNCDEFVKGDYIVYIKEDHLKEQLSPTDFAACNLNLTLLKENENFKVYMNNK